MGSTRHIFVAAAVAGTLAFGCLSRHQSTSDFAVGATVAGLDLDQAAGQLMMIGFKGPKLTPAIRATDENGD